MSITDILQLTPRTLADLNARDGEDIPAEDAKDIFDLFDKEIGIVVGQVPDPLDH